MSKEIDKQLRHFFDQSANQLNAPESIWASINEEINKEENMLKTENKRPKALTWLVSAVSLLVLAIGITAYAFNPIQLFNTDGEVLLTVEDLVDPAPQKNENVTLEDIRESLEPGQYAYVYFANDNPDGIVTTIFKPISLTDKETLFTKLGYSFNTPRPEAYGFHFEQALLHYDMFYENCLFNIQTEMYDCNVSADDLVLEATKTNQDVVIRVYEAELVQPAFAEFIYSNDQGDEITFRSTRITEWEDGQDLKLLLPQTLHQFITKHSISSEIEALFVQLENEHFLYWVEKQGNEGFSYRLYKAPESLVTLEQLLLVASTLEAQ